MKEIYKGLNIIGSDETGVGDYFTPLVAAAVFIPYQNIDKLVKLGVQDSKNISNNKIKEIAKEIKKHVVYSVRHFSQSGYNKLNKFLNAHELKSLLHISAINNVENKVDDYDKIIIDQYSSKESIKKYFDRLYGMNFELTKFKKNYFLVEKGESEHPSVAAASIIARDFLLTYMDKQNKEYNTVFPLGTSSITEKFAKEFVKEHGMEVLNKTAKIKFKTTKKLFGEIND